MKKINIQSLIQGNKNSWDEFVHEISPLLFHIVKKTLLAYHQSTDDIHDYLQDIFLHFCKDNFHILKQFDPQRSQLSTWCSVVARNKVVDRLRKKTLPVVSMDETHAQIADKTDTQIKAKLNLPEQLLSPRQQMVMRLLYEKDKDVKEVAMLLSVSEQTVRSFRHKALLKLRKYYKQ